VQLEAALREDDATFELGDLLLIVRLHSIRLDADGFIRVGLLSQRRGGDTGRTRQTGEEKACDQS
jgi:hypothetical protein